MIGKCITNVNVCLRSACDCLYIQSLLWFMLCNTWSLWCKCSYLLEGLN